MPMFMLNGNQYGGNGGNYQVARMSKADYDALTDEQKNDGTLRIVVDTAGNSVNYMSAHVAGAKTDDTLINFLNPILDTTTISGVECTNNGDGTYTLNGTATNFIDIRLSPFGIGQYSNCLALKPGKYKLVGTPEGIDEFHAHVGLVPNNGVERPTSYYDDGNGYILNHTDETIRYEYKISVNSGAVLNNVTFKPMLTPDLQATYDDFVGYTGGTGRLNSDVAAHQKEISRINSDLSERTVKTVKITKTVTIPQNSSVTVSLADDLPSGITDFEVLSARLGGYVLPYIEQNQATHANITNINEEQKTLILYSSTTAWNNYPLILTIGYTD